LPRIRNAVLWYETRWPTHVLAGYFSEVEHMPSANVLKCVRQRPIRPLRRSAGALRQAFHRRPGSRRLALEPRNEPPLLRSLSPCIHPSCIQFVSKKLTSPGKNPLFIGKDFHYIVDDKGRVPKKICGLRIRRLQVRLLLGALSFYLALTPVNSLLSQDAHPLRCCLFPVCIRSWAKIPGRMLASVAQQVMRPSSTTASARHLCHHP